MILDELGEFLDATAVNTGGAATYLLGDVIDLGAAHRDIGMGEQIWFVVTVDTSIASATGTLTVKLVTDAQAAIATDGSATEHIVGPTTLAAAMVAGKVLIATRLPAEGPVYERYMGVLQVTGIAALTSGKLNAFLTKDFAKWSSYADASN